MWLEDMVEIVVVVVTLLVGIQIGYLHLARLVSCYFNFILLYYQYLVISNIYIVAAKQKNKRGPSKGKNLEAVWKANGNRPLPVLFDKSFEGTYYGLGDNGTKMNTLLGSLVRTLVPPYYLSWDEVPVEVKAPIIPRVEVNIWMKSLHIISIHVFANFYFVL